MDARGEVCVLNDGKLVRAREEGAMKISLGPPEQRAAQAVLQTLNAALQDENGVHAESALTVMGGLIGQSLLMDYREDWSSVGPQFRAVFIEDVNQDLFECAQFLNSLLAKRLPGIGAAAAEIPEDHLPHPEALAGVNEGRPVIEDALEAGEVPAGQKRWVLLFALGELLGMTAAALHPGIGLRLALRAMVRASKTPPAHLAALEA